jgi:subtilisin-like proprotein convertase family protein
MKRSSKSLFLLIALTFLLFCLFALQPSSAQDEPVLPVALSPQSESPKEMPKMVRDAKAGGARFELRHLFQATAKAIAEPQLREVLSDGAILDLDKAAIERISTENVPFLRLPLPDGKGGVVELELVKVDIFTADFAVKTAKPTDEAIDQSLGVHYRGVVKGDDHSLAAISIFQNELMGFYSTEAGGNSILGRLGGNNPDNRHVLYAEKDLKVSSTFACDNKDDGGVALPESALQAPDQVAARCIRIYVEADFDLFQNKGSVSSTTSYVTGLFNQSATLFANDGIPISLSEVFVWNVQSPYAGLNTSLELLSQFQQSRNSFNGDLGHLVALRNSGGRAAGFDGFCNTSIDERQCISGIDPSFSSVPTYSWSIYVFTHEMGHLMGSRHTHACVWNGNGTAIDGCGPSASVDPPISYEGSCSGAPIPANGGTIMSYCHLSPNPGVNFSFGFGSQPRNLIVNRFNAASCLTNCGGGNCSLGVSPASRSFGASSSSSSFAVITGSTCPWTATVNAPSSSQRTLLGGDANPFSLANALNSQPTSVSATLQTLFGNLNPIAITDRSSNTSPPATGSLYPSTINVSGMTGTITHVDVSLNGVSHSFPDDIDVVLVGPGGQRVVLMSDVGSTEDLSGVNLIFDQSAGTMPDEAQISSGTYRPTNFNNNTSLEPGGIDNFPSPGPGQNVYGSDLGVFNGTAPNGAWRLYVVDDEHFDSGNIANGWALGILTSGGGNSWITITSGSSGTGNGTVNYSVAANTGANSRTGTITVNGQVHTVTQAGTGGGCPSTSISMGQTLNGSLSSADCIFPDTNRLVDVYSFSGVAGQGIAASMDSSAFDTYLYLANSANQVIAEDNNSGPGTNSRIPGTSGFFTLPVTGSYFLWASSTSSNSTGSYSVSLSQCTYSISTSANSVGPGLGSTNFPITAPAGCAWSATSDSPSWLTTSSSGSGNGTVRYDFTANNTTNTRTGRITVGGQVHTVTQIGLGGAGSVRFSSATYSANENGGDVTITVTRSGTGTGSVNYSTSNGTATTGADYVATSGTLLFGSNETSKTFVVRILEDTVVEASESINLVLSNPSASFTLGSPAAATFTIIDNDVAATTVRFNASSSSVTETLDATTKVNIVISRTGATSGSASVNYASSNGTANERSDYLATAGLLRFAPGEVSKTISVFVIDDRFGESAETFNITLSNPVGFALGTPSTHTVTIISNEVSNGSNPVRDASFNTDFYVRQHYLDFLNREPDSAGLAFWKNEINACGTQACRDLRKINVSAAFFLSIEFQQTGYLVERLYKTAYGNATGISTLGGLHMISVPIVRLNEFVPDTQQISRGVVIGAPNADQLLESNKQVFLADFVQRSRFLTAYPTSMTPAQFVDKLNLNAGGVLSASERNQLVNELTTGARTRAQVLRAVAEDANLVATELNRAFVLVQFFGYLRRNPNDSPDSDYTGYDFWLRKLDQFNGNFVSAEMVKAFIVSGEYQLRFGP